MLLPLLTRFLIALRRFGADRRASVTIEYGVVIMFIAVSLIGVAQMLAGKLNTALLVDLVD